MRLLDLQRRSLAYHWRAHLAVVLGVAVGTAALTGALLVGDALRGSLRATALDRLGHVQCVVQSPHFFRESLLSEHHNSPSEPRPSASGPKPPVDAPGSEKRRRPVSSHPASLPACPAILLRGSVVHADTRAVVHRINVLGVDQRFDRLGLAAGQDRTPSSGSTITLNAALAADLRAHVGDELLIRVGKTAPISPETLLGRRDDTVRTLRLTVDRIVPNDGLGGFTLNPRQTIARNAFIPLATLQRALRQPDRVNTLLIARLGRADPPTAAMVRDTLLPRIRLSDFGLTLRTEPEHGYIALESDALLLPPAAERAARTAAEALHMPPIGILTHLANSIETTDRPSHSIPYSTIVALETAGQIKPAALPTPGPAPGEIVLNDWAAQDLGAQPGDELRVTYYIVDSPGKLDTRSTILRLASVVPLAGACADPGFAPSYPGVTDAARISAWDPPFPIELERIRDQDERYWELHRATPKAFVALTDGQALWATQPERFGRLTSLRIYPPRDQSLDDARAALERELLAHLDPASLGMRIDDVRARALAASHGSTDFAGLFVGFSFFLIVSAALLVALLFRLRVERRASEIGLLLASGFSPGRVRALLLREGLTLALLGAVIGLAAARGYAWLMLTGLRTWWSQAVNAPFLQLHDAPLSYAAGLVGGVLVAAVSIVWSLRGIVRRSPRALLAGAVQAGPATQRSTSGFAPLLVALASTTVAALVIIAPLATDLIPPTSAFFVGGTALLIASLAAFNHWLHRGAHKPVLAGPTALMRLGVRNARRHPGRSLLIAALIAAATFTITSLQALRLTPTPDTRDRSGPTGGFTLLAESTAPLTHDLNTAAGRDLLNLPPHAQALLSDVTFVPCRLRDGDETSCLNLYAPTQPRLLGAADTLIERGGFAFAETLAMTDEQRRNPWVLLRKPLPDGVIPTIADEAAAKWQLHLQLGEELSIVDERGRNVRLRLVALLRGSVLQGELIVSEANFTRLFPSVAGHRFFLIDAPTKRRADVEHALEHELTAFGLAVTTTTERLAELQAVQNTYLSTFQTLGGLGLLLGTLGLTAVVLRSVWERRSELALLRALGFSRSAIGGLVLIENAFLIASGMLCGLLCAAIVVAPHLLTRATPIPWPALLAMFAAIFAAGLCAAALALLTSLRAPLLPALRCE